MANQDHRRGRIAALGWLSARPQSGVKPCPAEYGLQPLRLGTARDGVISVPPCYQPDRPVPLLVMLHRAGGQACDALAPVLAQAGDARLLLLAPESRGWTWDVILADYGPDVAFLDQALQQTFARFAIDPARIGIGGFSDGASYALSLGLNNGLLFTHVLAFSPGFIAPLQERGVPRLFIAHGTKDRVLPIEWCSRRIVPRLESAGYWVHYQEFDGSHTIPLEVAREAMAWLVGTSGSTRIPALPHSIGPQLGLGSIKNETMIPICWRGVQDGTDHTATEARK